MADYFTALDKENCADGFRWREGDALNAAIGQGDTVVTPLQMAMAYSAIANGGTVYEPSLIKAVVGSDGTVINRIKPSVKSTLDLPKSTLKFLKDSLPGVTTVGSGKTPFLGFPLESNSGSLKDRFGAGHRRQSVNFVVCLVRAGEQTAIRHRHDGDAGRNWIPNKWAQCPQDLRIPVWNKWKRCQSESERPRWWGTVKILARHSTRWNSGSA